MDEVPEQYAHLTGLRGQHSAGGPQHGGEELEVDHTARGQDYPNPKNRINAALTGVTL